MDGKYTSTEVQKHFRCCRQIEVVAAATAADVVIVIVDVVDVVVVAAAAAADGGGGAAVDLGWSHPITGITISGRIVCEKTK